MGETETKPLVTVVIIFLNAGPFIEEAIASVEAQTYPRWELALVDDGSTDKSTAIARARAERDPSRYFYVEHEGHGNRGMSASRNAGIARGTGKYVALLDADDVWAPGKLAEQVAMLEARPDVAMVYGPGENWYSWHPATAELGKDYVQSLGLPDGHVGKPPALVGHYLKHPGTTPGICSVLVRREAWERAGGFVESFRGMFEDQAFYLKLALRERILVSARCWFRYRQHFASCCNVAGRSGKYLGARRAFLDWVEGYLKEQGALGWRYRRRLRLEREKLGAKPKEPSRAVEWAKAITPKGLRPWLSDLRKKLQ